MDENLKKIIENASQKVAEEKPNDEAGNSTQAKKLYSKSPPYITVGNGLATKQYPADLSIDAFEVFNDLSRAQRGLFIKFKNILVKQNFDNWIAKNTVANPNIVYLSGTEDHDKIRAEMSKNRNGTNLENKGVLKKIKNNVYMLNPFILIPSREFQRHAATWLFYEHIDVEKDITLDSLLIHFSMDIDEAMKHIGKNSAFRSS